jgi:membrane associated rhomboid family serine protease
MSLVLIIIGITVIVSFSADKNPRLKEQLLFDPYRIKHQNEYYRLISSVLIHQDLPHLIFNMVSLYYLGSLIEAQLIATYGWQLGTINFALLYILGAAFAEIYPFIKYQDGHYRSLGASGAVSAVIFAAIIWKPTMKLSLLFLPIPISAYIFGPLYLAIEYFSMKRGNTGIAHDAHIGGAFFGILFILLLDPSKGTAFFHSIF